MTVEFKKGISNFELVGVAKVNQYTFKLDEKSSKSDWIYSKLNLNVDCGDGNVVSSELMGGYGKDRKNLCYVHGKKQSDKDDTKFIDDYDNQFTIDWDDRFDETVLSEVGEGCYLRVGIEKDVNDKIFTQKFLSAYDAIKYLNENKDKIDGKVVRVKGKIKYKIYNGSLQRSKEIESIYISAVEEKDFKAEFTQTILIDKSSYGRRDKETNLIDLTAYVVENLKDYDGKDISIKNKKGKSVGRNVPLSISLYLENEKLEKVLKVKKDVTEIAVVGRIIEGQAKSVVTYEDLDSDMQMLIDTGAYTLETLAKTIAVRGEKVLNWIIDKPVVKLVVNGEEKTPVISREEGKYKADDLILEFITDDDEEDVKDNKKTETKEEDMKSEDIDDFLDNL